MSGSRRWRRLSPLVVTAMWLMMAALPAQGKIPPFSVIVEPDPPVVGEQTTIVAEFEASFPVERLDGLLALYRLSDQGDWQDEIAITLERVTPTRFEATVVLPEAGRWVVKAFPDRTGWPTQEVTEGYPDTVELDVMAADTVWSQGESLLGRLTSLAGVAGVLGVAALAVGSIIAPRLRRGARYGLSGDSVCHATMSHDDRHAVGDLEP